MKTFNDNFFDYEVINIQSGEQKININNNDITYTFLCLKINDAQYLDESLKVINDVLKDFFPTLWKESFSYKSFAVAVDEDTLMGMGTPDLTMIPTALKKNNVKNPSSIVVVGSNLYFNGSDTKTKVWVGFVFNDTKLKFYMPSLKDSILPILKNNESSSVDDLFASINNNDINKFNQIVNQNPKLLSNKSSTFDEYPIMLASFKGNIHMLKEFNNICPDEFNRTNKDGKNSALIGITEGKRDAFNFVARIAPESLKHKDTEGYTCAAVAALRGYTDCLKTIIDLAPDTLSVKSVNGLTPASFAAMHGNDECIGLIIKTVPSSVKIPEEHGFTPATYAAFQDKNLNCLKLITENAPELLTFVDSFGGTPAFWAASKGAIKNLEHIYEKSPETLSMPDKNGVTPLAVAKEYQQTDTVKFIEKVLGISTQKDNKGCMLFLVGLTIFSSALLWGLIKII